MYLGRIVLVGKNQNDQLFLGYRISSRSFPNRGLIEDERGIKVANLDGHQQNRFITYHAMLCSEAFGVAGNGDHVNYIFDQVSKGNSIKNSLINVLNGMSYEHDEHNTPRIAAAIDHEKSESYLGVVSKSDLMVQKIELQPSEIQYVSTYQHNTLDRSQKHIVNANDLDTPKNICDLLFDNSPFDKFEYPISSCSAIALDQGLLKAIRSNPCP